MFEEGLNRGNRVAVNLYTIGQSQAAVTRPPKMAGCLRPLDWQLITSSDYLQVILSPDDDVFAMCLKVTLGNRHGAEIAGLDQPTSTAPNTDTV